MLLSRLQAIRDTDTPTHMHTCTPAHARTHARTLANAHTHTHTGTLAETHRGVRSHRRGSSGTKEEIRDELGERLEEG